MNDKLLWLAAAVAVVALLVAPGGSLGWRVHGWPAATPSRAR